MDQRQSNIEPHERFRAGAHTEGLKHDNPPLRPHGVLEQHELPKGPPRDEVGKLPDLPPDDSRLDSQSLLEADQTSVDVAAQLDKAGPAPAEPTEASE